MSETSHLHLPLLQPAQAQKHVTVNEALVRLDGLTQLTLASRLIATPPASASDGTAYLVPFAGVNEWSGQGGNIAVYSNGGWVFVPPTIGWRGYISDEAAHVVYDGVDWISGLLATSSSGAQSFFEIVEINVPIAAGPSVSSVATIPANTVVFGVSGRVTTAITGTLSNWQLGVAGSANRYGSGLGLGAGSWVSGLTGQPMAYYSATSLLLSANGGDFAGGAVTLAVHLFRQTPPTV